jgi:hypothetical protein
VNVNYVYGLSDAAPQTLMPQLAWLALLVTALPLADLRADAPRSCAGSRAPPREPA